MIGRILKILDLALAPEICPICRNDRVDAAGECCEACAKEVSRPLHACHVCGGENGGYLDTCSDCLAEDVRPWFQGATSFGYEGSIRNAIHRFKYNGQTYLAKFFGRQMGLAWQANHGMAHPEIIVPVPLHWTRRLSRGYNQTELICANLSKDLALPVVHGLKRRRATDHQARKKSSQRRTNLRGAFSGNATLVKGRDVLLVDDVFTTGATLAECTNALLRAGAREVSVLTIARD